MISQFCPEYEHISGNSHNATQRIKAEIITLSSLWNFFPDFRSGWTYKAWICMSPYINRLPLVSVWCVYIFLSFMHTRYRISTIYMYYETGQGSIATTYMYYETGQEAIASNFITENSLMYCELLSIIQLIQSNLLTTSFITTNYYK